MNQVVCEHPNIILHPLAPELIAQNGNYFIRYKEFRVSSSRRLIYDFSIKHISPFENHITHNDLDSCYILDIHTGEAFPLYLEVPCGKCDICLSSKQASWVQRCLLESQSHSMKPIFLTLTYNEENKPKDGVSIRDVQLFLKRLRINLLRSGYKNPIRYVARAEYGKTTFRPHYHLLLWGLGQTDFLSYRDISSIIKTSWSRGFCMLRIADPCDNKTFRYTTKYIVKNSNLPSGQSPEFLLSSNRHGGIGRPFLQSISLGIIKHLDIHATFLNKWSNRVVPLQFNRYTLNVLFPSFCHSLPPYLKTSVRTFVKNYIILRNRNSPNLHLFDDLFKQSFDFFNRYFFVHLLDKSEISLSMEDSDMSLISEMLRAEQVIRRAMLKGYPYYDSLLEAHKKRSLFLTKLFLHQEDVDINHRSYVCRKLNAAALERTIL